VTPAPVLAATLETALNLYLQQDPDALRRCEALQGKVVALDITGLGLSLYFLPAADGIQVLSHYEGEPDTRLRGSPLGLARMSLGSRDDSLFEGAVEISGDTETGQQLQDILAGTDWDWEEQLARLTGDVVAHQIGGVARRAGRLLGTSLDTLERDVSEYLQHEALLLPCRAEVDSFLTGVDRLRADTDRLSARVERLLQAAAARQ
jgi:ubiquinone biosynthesis protein UbiJ